MGLEGGKTGGFGGFVGVIVMGKRIDKITNIVKLMISLIKLGIGLRKWANETFSDGILSDGEAVRLGIPIERFLNDVVEHESVVIVVDIKTEDISGGAYN